MVPWCCGIPWLVWCSLLVQLITAKYVAASDPSMVRLLRQVSSTIDLVVLTVSPAPVKVDAELHGRQFAIYDHNDVLKALNLVEKWEKITYFADFADEDGVVKFIEQFGIQTSSFHSGWVVWRLVILWPVYVALSERQSLLEAKLALVPNITENIKIGNQCFIAFANSDEDMEKGGEDMDGDMEGALKPFSYYEVYGIQEHLIVSPVVDLGNISPECNKCSPWTGRRFNFHGRELRVGGIQDVESANDTEFKIDPLTKKVVFTKGFSVDQLTMLQEALNFTYTAEIWNHEKANQSGEISSWDGVIGAAQRGDIDLGVSASVHMPSRTLRVSMLPPTDEYVVSAFFHPPSLNAVRDIFTQPFKLDLWIAVITTWVILSMSMILFSAIRQRVGAEAEPGVEEPDFTQNSLIWAVATCCQQGWDEHPVSVSMRLIFIAGSFTAVIAYAGYSAAIVSTLSLKVEAIKTSDDLISNGFNVALRAGYLDIYLSQNQTDDAVTRIYRYFRKFKKSGRTDTVTGVNHLVTSKDKFAFVCVQDAFYDLVSRNLTDKEICAIRDMPILAQNIPVGPFTPKDSTYKQFFRVMLLRIRERGILWRLKTFYLYTRRCLLTEEGNEGQALKLNDVFTAFMVLLGGYALCLVFLGLETVYYRKTLIYLE